MDAVYLNQTAEPAATTNGVVDQTRRVLNVGSGPARAGRLQEGFDPRFWTEVRLDVDPATRPDLIGSVLALSAVVPEASYDAIWCSHVLEHLYGHEVVPALEQFRRVLKPDGFAVVTSPDIMAVAQRIVARGVDDVAYVSPGGPIAPLDMLYGHGASIEAGNRFMAHRTGFTADRLGSLAARAGFAEARVACGTAFDVWAILMMPEADAATIHGVFANTKIGRLLFGL